MCNRCSIHSNQSLSTIPPFLSRLQVIKVLFKYPQMILPFKLVHYCCIACNPSIAFHITIPVTLSIIPNNYALLFLLLLFSYSALYCPLLLMRLEFDSFFSPRSLLHEKIMVLPFGLGLDGIFLNH